MKLSDYVAKFLADAGIKQVFVVTGGAAAHLIDSVANQPELEYVCTQHEQAAAMAVDGYTRVTGHMGAAIATTGPGVMNLMTGMAGLYYDSLPAIFVTGQVSSSRLSRISPGVRQLGFQEAPHIELVKPVTKYAALIDDPTRIRYELEKAVHLATSGRPGPVLLDICDDVQRMEIDPDGLDSFIPEDQPKDLEGLDLDVDRVIELIGQAKRPILVLGAAVKIAKVEEQAKAFAERLQFPIALTWATMDMFPADHPLHTGGFGISASRRGNFAIQNADLVLSLGSRLDSHATGTPIGTFARDAKKIILDVDTSELEKFKVQGMDVDLLIQADVGDFLQLVDRKADQIKTQDISPWLGKIAKWRRLFPACLPEFYEQEAPVNPYVFLEALSEETSEDAIIVPDCGANLIMTFQGYRVKGNQKLFSAFNNSPMGYSLAASIGACFANDKNPVICIIGDGGLQLNIQELGTIVRNKLPIKIFLFNNHGYGIIQQTQEDWLDSMYWASKPQTGLADPDYVKIAEAYGINTVTINDHRGMHAKIREVLDSQGPVLCDLEFSQDQRIVPMIKAGRPIEDLSPLLERQRFLENMIVRPLEVSLEKE